MHKHGHVLVARGASLQFIPGYSVLYHTTQTFQVDAISNTHSSTQELEG